MRIALIIVVAIVLIVGLYLIYTKMIKPKNKVDIGPIGIVKSKTSATIEAPSIVTAQKGLGLIVQ